MLQTHLNLDAGPVVVRLTRNFIRKWNERVALPLSIENVNQTINNGVKISNQLMLYRRSQEHYRPCKVIAQYWNNDVGIIIKVDEDSRSAVTVITPMQP